MTDEQIEKQIAALIKHERHTTTQILNLISIAETRDIPLKRGYPSTYEWMIRGLGYSRSAAQRRIQSARLMRAVPAAEALLKTGAVNLTTLAKAQATIRAAEKISRQRFDGTRKAKVIEAITNQSSDEAEVTLLALFPETASTVHQERTKQITANQTRLTFNFGKDEMEDLAWAVDFLSHSVPDASHARVLGKVLAHYRAKHEGKSSSKSQRRTCEYRDEVTGRICGETFQIEDDHEVPRALGGGDEPGNLRCLCRRHNALVAKDWLGPQWANAWRGRAN